MAAAVLEHATEAAERAAALGAHREAAGHYAMAIGSADGLAPRRLAELLDLWGVGRSAEALGSATEAAAVLEAVPPGPALAAAWSWLAHIRMLARDISGAIEAGGHAIELAERFGQHEQLSRALNAVGTAQWFSDPTRRR